MLSVAKHPMKTAPTRAVLSIHEVPSAASQLRAVLGFFAWLRMTPQKLLRELLGRDT
jgi:hypothetical protein